MGYANVGVMRASSGIIDAAEKTNNVWEGSKEVLNQLQTRPIYYVLKENFRDVLCLGADRKMYWR